MFSSEGKIFYSFTALDSQRELLGELHSFGYRILPFIADMNCIQLNSVACQVRPAASVEDA
jgi:hypothetical protein